MRLLVVDDEIYTRKGIANIVDWKKYGINYILEAEDGVQAYEIALWFQPHIILTDIKMPKMDGIQFVEKIRGSCPDTRVIFTTSYMEVEYLKSAIQLSAVDYLQKPVNHNSIETAISKAVKMIEQDNENRRESEKSLQIRRQMYTVMLSYETMNNRIAQEIFAEMELLFKNDKFYCIIVDTSNANILEEFQDVTVSCGFDNALIGMRRPNYFVGLIGNEQQNVSGTDFRKLSDELLKDDRVHRVSFSMNPQKLDNFWIAYNEAAAAYEKSFFLPEENIFVFKDNFHYKVINFSLLDDFRLYVENGSKNVYEWMNNIKIDICKENYRIDQVKALYYSFINAAIEHNPIISKKLYVAEEHSIEPKQLWNKINSARNINVLHNILQETMDYFFEVDEENSLNRFIRDAVRYIHKNYINPDLSITDVANEVHLSSAYLNLSFKKEKGITLKQYIINYRLEVAKKMLKEHNIKIKDIATDCGFIDNGYFAKVFRKEIGMTPLEYRENILSK